MKINSIVYLLTTDINNVSRIHCTSISYDDTEQYEPFMNFVKNTYTDIINYTLESSEVAIKSIEIIDKKEYDRYIRNNKGDN